MKNSKIFLASLFCITLLALTTMLVNDIFAKEKPLAKCRKANQTCIDIPGPFDPDGVLVVYLD
ncbi:MAG: hypothetical protein HQ448_12685 [Cytophagales bacterium]|jgi:hypothetical protein|nr:hypothetical protein [Cytophagales bacterium]